MLYVWLLFMLQLCCSMIRYASVVPNDLCFPDCTIILLLLGLCTYCFLGWEFLLPEDVNLCPIKEVLFLMLIRFWCRYLGPQGLLCPTLPAPTTVLWLLWICPPHWAGLPVCPQCTDQVLIQRSLTNIYWVNLEGDTDKYTKLCVPRR